MSWVASLEVRSEDGIWYTMSATHTTRGNAWTWLRSKTLWCFSKRLRYRNTKIFREKWEPGQFDFLHGNEECAREWQDS